MHGDQVSNPSDLPMKLDSQLGCDLPRLVRVFRVSGSNAQFTNVTNVVFGIYRSKRHDKV